MEQVADDETQSKNNRFVAYLQADEWKHQHSTWQQILDSCHSWSTGLFVLHCLADKAEGKMKADVEAAIDMY